MTTLEILEKHFELSKIKYPNESWKRFEECIIEQEFIQNAMVEYAEQEVNKISSNSVLSDSKNFHCCRCHGIDGHLRSCPEFISATFE